MKLGRANCRNRAVDRQWSRREPRDIDRRRCQKRAKKPGAKLAKTTESGLLMAGYEELEGLAAKISARLAVKPEIVIMHPAELRVLHSLSDKEVRQFAAERGWRIVRRVGGRQIEFYNDASQRPEL
jgi:hypothetical protein